MAPLEIRDHGAYFGTLVKSLFGSSFGGVRMAHLTASDGVGIRRSSTGGPAFSTSA